MCVGMVEDRTRACVTPTVRSLSCVDDRYLVSAHPAQLTSAWEKSQQWHMANKWGLTAKKSVLVQSGTSQCQLEHRGALLLESHALTALGTQTPIRHNAECPLVKKRAGSARQMVARLDVLQLSPFLVQRLLGIIITSVCSGTSLNQASHGTLQEKSVLCALVHNPQSQDPLASCMYQHVKTICHTRCGSAEVEERWREMSTQVYPRRARSPYEVWQDALEYLGLTEPSPLLL